QEELLKGFGLERVMTVNLGVDTSLFSPFRRNPHFSKLLGIENKHKLLYVGRLSVDKNISLLLEVFQYLDPSLFHLVIVGDGPLRRKVEKLSKKLPNLTYLGYVHREEDLAEIYASCDIYVSASYRETYGLSFLEAQACGCILVSFDMDLETQPFKDFLVKEKSRKDFYKAIIRASNSLSPSLREEISSYIAKNFSWNSAFERLLNIYIAESLLTKS
ncbi:MAG: glycosyltransferase, partial [Aquificaceae bacterium]